MTNKELDQHFAQSNYKLDDWYRTPRLLCHQYNKRVGYGYPHYYTDQKYPVSSLRVVDGKLVSVIGEIQTRVSIPNYKYSPEEREAMRAAKQANKINQ